MNKIRKISVGRDYKDNAMHYAVGQSVYGGHTIEVIEKTDGGIDIYISKNREVILWKSFNDNMAFSIEFDLEY